MGKNQFQRKISRWLKCYFRDDEAVIFKDTSKNYYLFVSVRLSEDWAKTGERINSKYKQLGKEIKFRGARWSELSCLSDDAF